MLTVEALRSYHGVTTEEISDTDLATLERRVVAIIEKKTGWYFGELKTVEIVRQGSNQDYIWLVQPPVAITSISHRGPGAVEWIDYESTDYFVDSEFPRRIRKDSGSWPSNERIRFTISIGFEVGGEPEDIKQAVMSLVGYALNNRGNEGVQRRQQGDNTATFFDSAIRSIPLVAEALDNYIAVV